MSLASSVAALSAIVGDVVSFATSGVDTVSGALASTFGVAGFGGMTGCGISLSSRCPSTEPSAAFKSFFASGGGGLCEVTSLCLLPSAIFLRVALRSVGFF